MNGSFSLYYVTIVLNEVPRLFFLNFEIFVLFLRSKKYNADIRHFTSCSNTVVLVKQIQMVGVDIDGKFKYPE